MNGRIGWCGWCDFGVGCGAALLTDSNLPRVDLALQAESDDNSEKGSESSHDDDDDSDGETPVGSDPSEVVAKPTIQIQFAVGNMEGNPMMELLASPNEKNNTNHQTDAGPREEEGDEVSEILGITDRKRAIADLLQAGPETPTAAKMTTKKKTPLITEL